jgi:hypothetical protein
MSDDNATDTQSQSDDGTADSTTTQTDTDNTGATDTGSTDGGDGDGGDGGDGSGDDTQQSGDDAPKGAPETYAAFTLPEGMEADTALTDAFMPVAKELNLTQEQAQKLVDLQTGTLQAEAKGREDALTEQQTAWKKECKEHAEFGGTNFEANKVAASKFAVKVGGDEYVQLMESLGIADHPIVLRMNYRASQMIAEDTPVHPQGGGGGDTRSLAEKLYGGKAE